MRIAMFTNTYLPHVGGVANSVKTLEDQCRLQGHEVLVIAPEYEGAEAGESAGVLRMPAIRNFNGSDFSLRIPIPLVIHDALEDFQPHVIHSHHPFLLGDAALREAWKQKTPIVFTHHTLYERYTHYVPLDSPAMKRVAIQLATEYCNLCTAVIAPSESVRKLLVERGVRSRIEVAPTGIDTRLFASGDGGAFRRAAGFSPDVRLMGHVGRLAPEKNLQFLCAAAASMLEADPSTAFLVVGNGPEMEAAREALKLFVESGRVVFSGKKCGRELADAYAAMDLFLFASQTETQGMVLAEAMAAGKPVVALDGPGVREIVESGRNGVLLGHDAGPRVFSAAVMDAFSDAGRLVRWGDAARATAADYDQRRTTAVVTAIYERLAAEFEHREDDESGWDRFLATLQIEWDLMAAKMSAAAAAVVETPATEACLD